MEKFGYKGLMQLIASTRQSSALTQRNIHDDATTPSTLHLH
jgi:hypothetical protein